MLKLIFRKSKTFSSYKLYPFHSRCSPFMLPPQTPSHTNNTAKRKYRHKKHPPLATTLEKHRKSIHSWSLLAGSVIVRSHSYSHTAFARVHFEYLPFHSCHSLTGSNIHQHTNGGANVTKPHRGPIPRVSFFVLAPPLVHTLYHFPDVNHFRKCVVPAQHF